jgi:hypothetical protein
MSRQIPSLYIELVRVYWNFSGVVQKIVGYSNGEGSLDNGYVQLDNKSLMIKILYNFINKLINNNKII